MPDQSSSAPGKGLKAYNVIVDIAATVKWYAKWREDRLRVEGDKGCICISESLPGTGGTVHAVDYAYQGWHGVPSSVFSSRTHPVHEQIYILYLSSPKPIT